MKIVIDIDESEIPKQQDIIEIPLHFIDGKVCEAGGYGFDVLPKGHGRLIDADKTISKICGSSCGCHLEECGYDEPCFSVTRIESAPTIIEGSDSE